MKLIEVKVLFYSDKRKSLPCPFDYRPHFVVNGNYLGVQFVECDLTEFDKFGTAIVRLVYDGVDYSLLTENVQFDVVEGATIVGKGYVV
ncbi:MAG: hypothetical protein K2O39_03410 [Clostridiales bacterium]|nr:hypothetical protein [Clostridiales bacterium]